jgi:hypothetical protein
MTINEQVQQCLFPLMQLNILNAWDYYLILNYSYDKNIDVQYSIMCNNELHFVNTSECVSMNKF